MSRYDKKLTLGARWGNIQPQDIDNLNKGLSPDRYLVTEEEMRHVLVVTLKKKLFRLAQEITDIERLSGVNLVRLYRDYVEGGNHRGHLLSEFRKLKKSKKSIASRKKSRAI